jgi:N-glycosidase YbiA
MLYPTVEHAYQASKVKHPAVKASIRDCPTPAEAKDFFEVNKIETDKGWTIEKKLGIMEELLRIKFGGKDPFLTRALLDTGGLELIEENNWDDHFWGVCNTTGENYLGKLLMKIRAELIQQKQTIVQLSANHSNDAIADALSITRKDLYEKMIAFKIQNKEFWIS